MRRATDEANLAWVKETLERLQKDKPGGNITQAHLDEGIETCRILIFNLEMRLTHSTNDL